MQLKISWSKYPQVVSSEDPAKHCFKIEWDLVTFLRSSTYSLQIRHFLTRSEHPLQTATWAQGKNRVSLFWSEQTRHSSRACSFFLASSAGVGFIQSPRKICWTWLLKSEIRNYIVLRIWVLKFSIWKYKFTSVSKVIQFLFGGVKIS